MNLLLLPGASSRSGEWLKQVEASLASQFDRTHRHEYAHWENGDPDIDLDKEVDRLTQSIDGLSPYMIFAKSAGTILTSKATFEGILRPSSVLFVGLPLIMIRDHSLPAGEWVRASDFPLAVLQHTNDPFGSFNDVEEFMASTNRSNAATYEIDGDSHDYLEYQVIQDYMRELAGRE